MKRQRDLFLADRARSETTGFTAALVGLGAHIAGSAVLFFFVAFLAWLVGAAVDGLNKVHPFPESILGVVHAGELWLLYADIALFAVVVLYGIIMFLIELRHL